MCLTIAMVTVTWKILAIHIFKKKHLFKITADISIYKLHTRTTYSKSGLCDTIKNK